MLVTNCVYFEHYKNNGSHWLFKPDLQLLWILAGVLMNRQFIKWSRILSIPITIWYIFYSYVQATQLNKSEFHNTIHNYF